MVDAVDQEDNIDVDTLQHEAEGSLRKGWPALIMTVVMISAAIYAFSPRPYPPFAPTEVKSSQLMTGGLAAQGSRHIAVGELGIILIADSPDGPWRRATVEPQRGANLTNVKFIADGKALAVGHSGWLLRSDDGGESWYELSFNENSADPLLGVSGPFEGPANGRIFAYGAFGQMLVSQDGGNTWQSRTLQMAESDEPAAEAASTEAPAADEDPFAAAFDPSSEDYDPFAEFESGGMAEGFSTRHFYSMIQASDGSLYLAGERGMVLRSTNGGNTWKAGDEIYTGSFYGLLETADKNILVFGMRGNAFITKDQGQSWQPVEIPLVQGLYNAALADDGTIVVVGASNTILVSRDGGMSFMKASKRGPFSFSTIIALDDGGWLMAGEGGIGTRSVLKSAGDQS